VELRSLLVTRNDPSTFPKIGIKIATNFWNFSGSSKKILRTHIISYMSRCSHFSLRLGHKLTMAVLDGGGVRDTVASSEIVSVVGGTTSLAEQLHRLSPSLPIGIMIAGNSGRPGGSCGHIGGRARDISARHSTQEEDIVSSWFLTECKHETEHNYLFQSTIDRQWGLVDVSGRSTDPTTIQGVDYNHAEDPMDYADSWSVCNCVVSQKMHIPGRRQFMFDTSKKVPCTLVFVAGPHAGPPQKKTGSMARTKNIRASRPNEYEFFKHCVASALRTGLDAMIRQGCQIALVARISCGIYAGPHKQKINAEFLELLDELLLEEMVLEEVVDEKNIVVEGEEVDATDDSLATRRRVVRGSCFDRVIVPMLCLCSQKGECRSCMTVIERSGGGASSVTTSGATKE